MLSDDMVGPLFFDNIMQNHSLKTLQAAISVDAATSSDFPISLFEMSNLDKYQPVLTVTVDSRFNRHPAAVSKHF